MKSWFRNASIIPRERGAVGHNDRPPIGYVSHSCKVITIPKPNRDQALKPQPEYNEGESPKLPAFSHLLMTPSQSLAKRPDEETKQRIGRAFFGSAFEQGGGLDAFECYFKYYEEEIDWLQGGVTPETDQLAGLAGQTHDDLLIIANVLRQNAHCNRSEIRAKFRESHGRNDGEDWAINRSIDITIRLWLQINVRDTLFRDSGKGVPDVQWDELQTLTEFLSSLFPVAKWELGAKERRLDPYFTGANMVEFCDLKIDWTTSLEDHLRLDRVRKVLWVFPYKRNLQALLSEADNKVLGHGSVQRFLEE